MQILEDFIKNSASSGSSDGVARHSLNSSPISFKNVLCERLLGCLGDEMWCSAKLAIDTVFFSFTLLWISWHSTPNTSCSCWLPSSWLSEALLLDANRKTFGKACVPGWHWGAEEERPSYTKCACSSQTHHRFCNTLNEIVTVFSPL